MSNLPKVTQLVRTNVPSSYPETKEGGSGKGEKQIVQGAVQEEETSPTPTRCPKPFSTADSSQRVFGFRQGEMRWEGLPRYELDLGSGLGSRQARGCSNGAGATRKAGRGYVAIWSHCRRRPQSRRDRRECKQGWKECSRAAAAAAQGPAPPLPPHLAPAAPVLQLPAVPATRPAMSLSGASERSVPATKIEITVSCR